MSAPITVTINGWDLDQEKDMKIKIEINDGAVFVVSANKDYLEIRRPDGVLLWSSAKSYLGSERAAAVPAGPCGKSILYRGHESKCGLPAGHKGYCGL